MALQELFPRRFTRTAQSMGATRKFMCEWAERDNVMPRMGEQHPDREELFVETIDEEQLGRPDDDPAAPTMCRLIVQYSTRTPYRPIRTTDLGIEMLETTGFRTWKNAGTISTMHATIPYGVMDHGYETVSFVDPRPIMDLVLNCVNGYPWEGFGRGCVLYLGGKVRTEYTNLGEGAWRVWHRFWIRKFDWNKQWREGRQKRYKKGHPQAGGLQWDDDTGDPSMVDGPAGSSGWDTLIPLLYEYANFNMLYQIR